MVTQLSPPTSSLDESHSDSRSRMGWGIALVAVVVGIVVVASTAQHGAVTPRITNPAVTGAPRPVQPLWGFHHWITLFEVGTVVMMAALAVVVVMAWGRYPRHPILLMVLVTTLLVWQDPVMNWAPYAVYNPQLWHWPATWGLESLSPTVEPFLVIGYATFYMAPFFPAVWLLRRLQARRPREGFVSRHPVISLSLLIFAIGFIFDTMLETFLIRAQLYIYSQVVPFGSIDVGKWYQFPLIWEASLVSLVMIPAGILMFRDDTGRTQAEKLALRFRSLCGRPALGTFVVMFLIINVAYVCYGGSYAVLKDTKLATSVACPWPFPEAKVYDPNGIYEQNGQPGPYSAGIWSGWESGQPNGRPNVTPPAHGGRCGDA